MVSKKALAAPACIFTIIGTLIGAGFASGREIITFFTEYGAWGIAMSSLFFLVLFCCTFFLLKLGSTTSSLSSLNKLYFKRFAPVFDVLFLVCYFVVFSSMLAGMQVVVESLAGEWLYYIILLLLLLVLANGLSSLLKFNNVFLPLLIVFLCVLPIVFLASNHNFQIAASKNVLLSPVSALLYSCMNIATATAVILPLGAKIGAKKYFLVAAVSTIIISGLFVVLMLALVCLPPEAKNLAMPVVYMARGWLLPIALCFLLVATATTLFSCGYPLVEFAGGYLKNKYVAATAVLVPAVLLSSFGFSNIVRYLYPAMGVLGLLHLVFIAIKLLITKIKKLGMTRVKN